MVDATSPAGAGSSVPPRWAAVVVNYESGGLLRGAVDSLSADDSAGAPEIVVVDNGSRDGSVAQLRDAYRRKHMLASAS